jgi:hypothetical protein
VALPSARGVQHDLGSTSSGKDQTDPRDLRDATAWRSVPRPTGPGAFWGGLLRACPSLLRCSCLPELDVRHSGIHRGRRRPRLRSPAGAIEVSPGWCEAEPRVPRSPHAKPCRGQSTLSRLYRAKWGWGPAYPGFRLTAPPWAIEARPFGTCPTRRCVYRLFRPTLPPRAHPLIRALPTCIVCVEAEGSETQT